jgi:hypothetical protein
MAKYGLPPPKPPRGPKKGSREEYLKFYQETASNSAQLGELTRQVSAMTPALLSIQEHHGILSAPSTSRAQGSRTIEDSPMGSLNRVQESDLEHIEETLENLDPLIEKVEGMVAKTTLETTCTVIESVMTPVKPFSSLERVTPD